MKPARLLRVGAAAAGAGVLGFGAWSVLAWARYGHVDPGRHPPDELLDRFLPDPEVDEYHQVEVRAPAAITLAAAKETDLQSAPLVKAIFWLRAVPALLRGEPFRPQGSRGIVEQTLGLGWGVLAEEPDREIVIGAYTQPWHEQVTFHPCRQRSSPASTSPATSRSPGRWGPSRWGRMSPCWSPAPVRSPPIRSPAGSSAATGLRCRPGSSSSATPVCRGCGRRPSVEQPTPASLRESSSVTRWQIPSTAGRSALRREP